MERVCFIRKRCTSGDLAEMLAAAATAAMEAGRIIRELTGRQVRVEHKGTIDLVTEADRAAEERIVTTLTDRIPGVGVMAEESCTSFARPPAEPTWIIDPLDGTTNFAHGFPWFAVSIALWQEGRSRAGVIYSPMTDELFWAGEGEGAWLNESGIRVSGTSFLEGALVATGFPYDIHQESDQVLAALGRLVTRVQGVRRAGAAALDLALVACGRLDGFWEIKLKPWDSAAGQVLVIEAGGQITDFAGAGFSPFVPELLASNARIHPLLVTTLREFSRAGSRGSG